MPLGVIDEIVFEASTVEFVIRSRKDAIADDRNGIDGQFSAKIAYVIGVANLLLADIHHHYTKRHGHIRFSVVESKALHLFGGIELLEIEVGNGTDITLVIEQVNHAIVVSNDECAGVCVVVNTMDRRAVQAVEFGVISERFVILVNSTE